MDLSFLLTAVLFFSGLDDTLAIAQLPAPTPEINKLIELMGDDEWRVREDANKKLKDMGFKALKALMHNEKHNKDLEIRVRCRRTVASYFGMAYPKNEVVEAMKADPTDGWVVKYGKKKYVVSRDEIVGMYKAIWYELGREPSSIWYDDEVSREITRRYVRKMLLRGVPREDIAKSLIELNKRAVDSTDLHKYGQMSMVPGPRGGMPRAIIVGFLGNAKLPRPVPVPQPK